MNKEELRNQINEIRKSLDEIENRCRSLDSYTLDGNCNFGYADDHMWILSKNEYIILKDNIERFIPYIGTECWLRDFDPSTGSPYYLNHRGDAHICGATVLNRYGILPAYKTETTCRVGLGDVRHKYVKNYTYGGNGKILMPFVCVGKRLDGCDIFLSLLPIAHLEYGPMHCEDYGDSTVREFLNDITVSYE